MFKKLLLIILLVGTAIFLLSKISGLLQSPPLKKVEEPKKAVNQNIVPLTEVTYSIFVPYWALGDATIDYDRLFYFGVAASRNGINKFEPGYKGLAKFNTVASGHKKYLTLRMLDANINYYFLEQEKRQQKLIDDTISIAKSNEFGTIVLDLELFSVLSDKVPNQINSFIEKFYLGAKERNLDFMIVVYGDTFYRKRPFNIAYIAQYADEVIIMAYDFHKSRGEPGPNFPLNGRDKYGYDFATMIKDYTAVVPREKISVAFGMFGYDWKVDAQKRPIREARAIPLKQITEEFVTNCSWKDCTVIRDTVSHETEVNYVDEQSNLHILWFEDEKSVEDKIELLKRNGIDKVVYWTYSYF